MHYINVDTSAFRLTSSLGIGESIRGLAIDIADFGKGSGKEISEDGKAEVKQGVRKLEDSVHR